MRAPVPVLVPAVREASLPAPPVLREPELPPVVPPELLVPPEPVELLPVLLPPAPNTQSRLSALSLLPPQKGASFLTT